MELKEILENIKELSQRMIDNQKIIEKIQYNLEIEYYSDVKYWKMSLKDWKYALNKKKELLDRYIKSLNEKFVGEENGNQN